MPPSPAPVRTPVLLSLLALLSALAGCRDAPRAVETTVLQSSGPVESTGRAAGPVAAGALLPPGGRVRVKEGGACVLAPLPGVMVRLTGPAELFLDEAFLGKANDTLTVRRFRATLLAGRAQVWLDEPGATSFDGAIATPAGVVRLRRGALAEVAVTGADTAEVLCADGLLSAAPALEAGEGTWSAGAAATGFGPPQAAADDEARWQRVVDLREAEALFVRLSEAQRLLRPERLRQAAESRPWR